MDKKLLKELLTHVDKDNLIELIYKLAKSDNSAYSKIPEFLRIKVDVPENIKQKSDEEAIWSIWNDLEDDLSELDEYGGGDYDTEDSVAELLYELSKKLE